MAITELRISGVRGVVHDTVLGPTPNNGGAPMLTFKLYIVVLLVLVLVAVVVVMKVVDGGFLIN